jgi:hypothetical protein
MKTTVCPNARKRLPLPYLKVEIELNYAAELLFYYSVPRTVASEAFISCVEKQAASLNIIRSQYARYRL